MDCLPIYLSINILTLAAFFLGLRWPGRRTFAGILLTALVLAIVALKFLFYTHPAAEARLFPWPAYGYLRPFTLFPPAMLALGLLLPQLGPRLNRRILTLLIIMMTGLLLRATQSALPPAIGAPVTADIDHNCRQSTPQNCGPAACVSALSYVNIPTDERTMATLCLTARTGTTDYGIFRGLSLALENSPYRARMAEPTFDNLTKPGTLAVISTDSHTHAICTLGTGTGVIAQDPLLIAPAQWSCDELQKHYSGVATIIESR